MPAREQALPAVPEGYPCTVWIDLEFLNDPHARQSFYWSLLFRRLLFILFKIFLFFHVFIVILTSIYKISQAVCNLCIHFLAISFIVNFAFKQNLFFDGSHHKIVRKFCFFVFFQFEFLSNFFHYEWNVLFSLFNGPL